MAAMTFTTHAVTSKGKGQGKSMSVYPLSRKLAARDLAQRLTDERGRLRPDRWDALVQKGDVSDIRTRKKDGSVISFIFGGRKIRFATLEEFLPRVAKAKSKPLAPTSQAQEVIHGLARDLQLARRHRRRLPSQPTKKQRQPKPPPL